MVKQQKVVLVRKIPAKAATMVADEYESQQRMDTGEKTVSFSHEDEVLEIESRDSAARKHNAKIKLKALQTRLTLKDRPNQTTPSIQSKELLSKSRKIIKLKPSAGSPLKQVGLKSDQKFNGSIKNRLALKKSLKSPDLNNLVTKVNHVSISARLGSTAAKKPVASSSVFDRLGFNKKK